jgi:hypothetical protein
MTKLRDSIMAAALLAANSLPYAAPEIPCLKGKQAELVRASWLIEAIGKAWSGPQCAQLARVVAQLQGRSVSGGRKLHGDKPLDQQAARQELQAARADAQFMRKLDIAAEGVTDPTARLAVEAALLDDEGYFSARQLLIDEIAAKTQEAK